MLPPPFLKSGGAAAPRVHPPPSLTPLHYHFNLSLLIVYHHVVCSHRDQLIYAYLIVRGLLTEFEFCMRYLGTCCDVLYIIRSLFRVGRESALAVLTAMKTMTTLPCME